ncbi:MAG TPA: hypothetical protein VMH30_07530 [Verrucomicrobiae bacterium]|nr:hypothetical protein [Verrucomicrobiae bacterium]
MKTALMSLPFAAMGLIAFIMLLHDGVLGGLTRDSAIKLVSVIVVAAGFVTLIFGVAAKKTSLAAQLKASLAEDPEKPWLKRSDWAAGRIKSAGTPDAKSFLIMGIALCVLGGLIAILVVPIALRTKNYSDLVALLFPAVGIAFLTSVLRKVYAHRRFGDCFFEMTQVPAPPGGALQGAIRTTLPLPPEQKPRLQLFCVCRTASGSAQHRRTDEKILWEDEQTPQPPTEPNSTAGNVRVLFDLPPNAPPCSQRGNETVFWRLEMKIPSANFHATFEVPIFKITGNSAADK